MYAVVLALALLLLGAAIAISMSLWNLRRSRWIELQRRFPAKQARPGAPSGMTVAEMPRGKRYAVRWTLDDSALHLTPEHADLGRLSIDYFHRPVSVPLEQIGREERPGAAPGAVDLRAGGVDLRLESRPLRHRLENASRPAPPVGAAG